MLDLSTFTIPGDDLTLIKLLQTSKDANADHCPLKLFRAEMDVT